MTGEQCEDNAMAIAGWRRMWVG